MNEKAIEAAAQVLFRESGVQVLWKDAGREAQDMWLAAAESAIAAYEKAMWRPIEEAPDEWKIIPVIVGRGDIPCSDADAIYPGYSCEAFWSDDHKAFTSVSEHIGVFVPDRATHLRPLPKPEGI